MLRFVAGVQVCSTTHLLEPRNRKNRTICLAAVPNMSHARAIADKRPLRAVERSTIVFDQPQLLSPICTVIVGIVEIASGEDPCNPRPRPEQRVLRLSPTPER